MNNDEIDRFNKDNYDDNLKEEKTTNWIITTLFLGIFIGMLLMGMIKNKLNHTTGPFIISIKTEIDNTDNKIYKVTWEQGRDVSLEDTKNFIKDLEFLLYINEVKQH